jgi:hypothetical protein
VCSWGRRPESRSAVGPSRPAAADTSSRRAISRLANPASLISTTEHVEPFLPIPMAVPRGLRRARSDGGGRRCRRLPRPSERCRERRRRNSGRRWRSFGRPWPSPVHPWRTPQGRVQYHRAPWRIESRSECPAESVMRHHRRMWRILPVQCADAHHKDAAMRFACATECRTAVIDAYGTPRHAVFAPSRRAPAPSSVRLAPSSPIRHRQWRTRATLSALR